MNHKWLNEFTTLTEVEQKFTDKAIEAEPQFYASDPDYVETHAGPITKAFISALARFLGMHDFDRAIIDTRSHMLLPGMYPCIPGWHLDNKPRFDGLPQMTVEQDHQHFLMTFGEQSPTQFLTEPFLWRDIKSTADYRAANDEIERQCLDRQSVVPGSLVTFRDVWHRGRPATAAGWRWFGRLTMLDNRTLQNKIRTQTQAYVVERWA